MRVQHQFIDLDAAKVAFDVGELFIGDHGAGCVQLFGGHGVRMT